jgi:diguanylate cyclase (GGDEF)-like protein
MSAMLDNQHRKILVVDDDPQSRLIVSKALQYEGYQVEQADSGESALKKMQEGDPHLVLLDVSMPGLNGLDTLKLLRDRNRYVSCLFVSGKSDTEDVIRGLDAGADDYICKPFDTLELLARVRSQLRIKDLNDRLQVANARLKELVDIDDLTGLFNMRSLYKKLDFEIERAQRYKRSVCVIMMDMDKFKSVNDTNDHLFGSFVLAEVGKIIRGNIRKVDFGARYGGDEFLIVLTEIDKQGAEVFSERLREKIEKHLFKNDNAQMHLTSSLGFAIASPSEHKIDARTLVRYADRALYKAKEKGRNRVESYDFSAEDAPLAPQDFEALRKRGK